MSKITVEKLNKKTDGQFVKLVFLELSDRPTEQASTDKENQVGHDDEEDC